MNADKAGYTPGAVAGGDPQTPTQSVVRIAMRLCRQPRTLELIFWSEPARRASPAVGGDATARLSCLVFPRETASARVNPFAIIPDPSVTG